jgi:flagellar protein FlgJ
MPTENIGIIQNRDNTIVPKTYSSGANGQSILSLTGDTTKTDKEKLSILAREFESIFTNQMLKTMRSTISKNDLINGGPAEEMFTSMLDEEMAREMAFSQNSGLSKALEEQLWTMIGEKAVKEPGKDE